jgi:predicted deacylase
MTGPTVLADVDLESAGKRFGLLRVPRSTNTAGWSNLCVPIAVIVNGSGPTVLVMGGNHGDEPEGQVAALNLARETAVEDVSGRLIVIPVLSPEAARSFTRLWPSGANFNRVFPGRPDGTPAEQLADYLTRVLFPIADVVVDLHSGGRSTMVLPWSEMHVIEDPDQRRRMARAMLAFLTDWCCVYIDVAGSGLLVGEAERQGKLVVSTELGGGGQVPVEIHRLARRGLANVLRHVGVLRGEVRTRADLGLPPPRVIQAIDVDGYLFAPCSGLFETQVALGEQVGVGQPVGRILDPERPDRDPEVIRARTAGIACEVRAIGPTEHGDVVAVVAEEIDVRSLL